jgi:alkanesulfonate monooxygenase SsuD/methylene tetrahydromethanopterin reductase-like flavin-dependent oxidoreductase (luciferase family)
VLFSIGGSSGLTWPALLEVVQTAEECGYFGFYPSDHLMQIAAGRGPSGARLDSVTMIACLAGYTTKLRLGTLVLGVLFRHPVIVAKMFNTIDQATNGRAELGIGATYSPDEHTLHGFAYPDFKERLGRLEEALEVIIALWTQQRATFNGKYYSLGGVEFEPKPVQKPYPPIIIGGKSKGTLRIAARFADDWDILGPPRDVEASIAQMKAICAERGRDFAKLRVSHQMQLFLTDSKADYEAIVDRQVQAASGPHFPLSTRYASPEEQVRDSLLGGDVEMVKEGVRKWKALGVTHLNFMTPRPFNRPMLERFAKEVMPEFA